MDSKAYELWSDPIISRLHGDTVITYFLHRIQPEVEIVLVKKQIFLTLSAPLSLKIGEKLSGAELSKFTIASDEDNSVVCSLNNDTTTLSV